MTLRTLAGSAATRIGGVLSILAIIAASVVGLHGWADGEATDIGGGSTADSGHGITG
jgi:hypothetical protein